MHKINLRFLCILWVFVYIAVVPNFLPAQSRKGKQKKQKIQIAKIDSSQIINIPEQKLPVIPFRDTLFYIHGNMGSFLAKDRTKAIGIKIQNLEKDPFFDEVSVKLIDVNGNINITYRGDIVATIDTIQALSINKSKSDATEYFRELIVNSIQKEREDSS